MKILIFILVFFIVGALFIISNHNLAMCKQENVDVFSGLYLEWINQLYLNLQILIKDIVRLGWFPK